MKVLIEFDPLVDAIRSVIATVQAVYSAEPEAVELAPMFNANEIQASHMAQAAAGLTPAPLSSGPAPSALGASAPAPTTAASAQAVPATSGGAVLDAVGVPWDARIHSSAVDEATGLHKKTAKGVWIKRKGVYDLTYTTVTNELLNLMASKPQVAATLQPAVAQGNPVHVPHQVAVPVAGSDDEYEIEHAQPLPVPAAMQPAPLAPAVMPAPVLAAPIIPHDFATLMQYVSVNLQTDANPAGKLTQADIQRICAHFQLVDANGQAAIAMLQHRPDYVGVVYQSFAAQIAAVAG